MAFSYTSFARGIIDLSTTPVHPSSMVREAMAEGAPHSGEELRKQLRSGCESVANHKGYRRVKIKGVKGYQYMKDGINYAK